MNSLILSGGIGSRLWPLSRRKYPKQFIELFEQSLFEATLKRLSPMGPVFVCTGQSLKSLTDTTVHRSGLPVEKTFYEPVGRNTAPAIGLVCRWLEMENRSSEVLGVFPSDHWIDDEQTFQRTMILAEDLAEHGKIVTLGIKPDHPATGFGYVECESQVIGSHEGLEAFAVKGFREKPNMETAKEFLAAGSFFWNSGMFVFRVSTMIEAFKSLMPELWEGLSKLDHSLENLDTVFPNLPAESIDYGIMERFKNQANIPCDLGWSDMGSWDDVAQAGTGQSLGAKVELVSQNSHNCFVYSENEAAIALSHVEDLIIVNTQDALLVCKRGESQSVKDLFVQVESQAKILTLEHSFEKRPWGDYRNVWEEEQFKTKVITVSPHQQLSYQSHQHRSETWVVVDGVGEVVLDDEVIPVKAGTVVQIPTTSKHRMRNTGDKVLRFVEVQLGSYFGEDDIVRYEDDYKRV